MLAKLRRHLTYANVVSTLCLFILLGGSSYAAVTLRKNSVKGKNIAANAVTSPKVKNGSLLSKDFKAGQIPAGSRGPKGETGPQGLKGNAGAPNPNAADSDRLDGLDSSEFVQGRGQVISNRLAVFVGDPDQTFLSLPRFGNVVVACVPDPNGQAGIRFDNHAGDDLHIFQDHAGSSGNDPIDSVIRADGLGYNVGTAAQTDADSSGRFTFHIGREEGAAHRLAEVTVMAEENDGNGSCVFTGMAVINSG